MMYILCMYKVQKFYEFAGLQDVCAHFVGHYECLLIFLEFEPGLP